MRKPIEHGPLTPQFFVRLKEMVDYRTRPDDPKLYTWNCDHDLRRARWTANELKIPWAEAKAFIDDHGGKCDCLVIWNVYGYWRRARSGYKCCCGFTRGRALRERAADVAYWTLFGAAVIGASAAVIAFMGRLVEDQPALFLPVLLAWFAGLGFGLHWFLRSRGISLDNDDDQR